MTAKDLIASIQLEKKQAVEAGILREEKSLGAVTDNEAPYKLPQDWEWCHLGDYAMKVTDYVASGSFASLKENVLITNDENYAVMVKTADFSNGFTKNLTYTDKHGYDFLENSNLFGGELILSNIGSIGKVFIVPDLGRPMTLASNTIMVRMTHSEYNRYMYYLFVSPYGQKLLKSISSGTSMLKFNKTQLKATVIPVAPLEEQNKICNTLDQLQSIISKREEELKKLDDLIKARFVEMFDLDNCRYGTFEDDTDFVDYRGKTPELSDEGTIRMVNAKSVGKGFFKDVDEYVTEDTYNNWMHRGFGFPGDVLFVTEGHTFGNTCLVPDYLTKFALGQRVITIKGHTKTIENAFLCAYMQTEQFLNDINVFRTGGTAQGIRSKDLIKVRIPLPDLDEQKRFAAFTKQVDKSKLFSVIYVILQLVSMFHQQFT